MIVNYNYQHTVEALSREGRPFIGVLYAGFMLTAEGPMVLEYNCRFGDPETQVLLPLLQSDLFDILSQCAEGKLLESSIQWKPDVACTVVCAAPGYPSSYPKGLTISGFEEAASMPDVKVWRRLVSNDVLSYRTGRDSTLILCNCRCSTRVRKLVLIAAATCELSRVAVE